MLSGGGISLVTRLHLTIARTSAYWYKFDMSAFTWDLPLGASPQPIAIAIGSHGPGRLRYALHGQWQLHLYPYRTTAMLGGVACDIRPGCATITPPDAEMVYDLSGTRTHTYAHFTVPAGAAVVAAPVLVQLEHRYTGLEKALQEASGWTGRQSTRAAARLWDILWTVVSANAATTDESLVDRARDLIEARLGTRLPVSHLARELGCSHGHLVRRFRAALGTTVVGWIHARRVQRAAHLLRHSSLPITDIARSVGVYDLHAFNKLVRRGLGAPPRQIRAER